MMKKRILGALAFLGATAAAPAMAADLFPPWGDNTPVTGYVGSYRIPTSPPAPVIVIQIIQWKRKSDGVCSGQQIGSSAGLSDNYVVHGTTGDDTLAVSRSTFEVCGITMGALAYNGHWLDIVGDDGKDRMTTYAGDTYLLGQAGDDDLWSENPNGRVEGGTGADKLTYNGPSGSAALVGDSGNDCLDDRNRTSSTFDCGPGTDTRITGHYPVSGTTSCEVTNCVCSSQIFC